MRVIKGAYLTDGVIVTGDVVLGAGCNLWYGTIVRGDLACITLGETANIQDGCILHTDTAAPMTIGSGVVVGHAAVLHCSAVGPDTLIGIGARLLSGSEVGPECIVAAGAVVVEGAKVPPRSVVMGIPGRVVRPATVDEVARTRAINARYLELARRYVEGRIERPYGD
jgi:carbonic anhydrase/acetyltransferase-like protein (isoleucine patch superfamily)